VDSSVRGTCILIVSFPVYVNYFCFVTYSFVMQPELMVDDPDDYTVARHLEAYLLWLFGWTMFTSSQGNVVSKYLIYFAQQIADAPLGDVPQFSWASAVLANMYRGLCDACTRTDPHSILSGCPLLLQLWSYSHFYVGRPQMDFSPFPLATFYGDSEVDAPTAGTVWCRRRVRTILFLPFQTNCYLVMKLMNSLFVLQPRWANVQVHKAYPELVKEFDRLQDADVQWTPYYSQELLDMVPHGLSSLCTRDSVFWLTKKALVFDICVEAYSAHRVMRQFGIRQLIPPPVVPAIPSSVHL
jgi:hypothetical protein